MPLSNNKENQWNGYLIEGFAGTTEQFIKSLQTGLTARNLPKFACNQSTVNMWWRKNSPCLDIISDLDDTVSSTVHVMDYGTALFVGIAYNSSWITDNYYKRMAATCFLETIDRCVCEAIEATGTILQKEGLKLTAIGKAGKFGG